ncbi:MAG: hypothetical protein KME49_20600 [Brasilonema octagenarum HA4186-MV1]|nr:hypothetical protein [Brasilonema octagenarum HA4186-MV1]
MTLLLHPVGDVHLQAMSNDKPYACGTAAPIGFTVACGGASTVRAAWDFVP